MNLEKQEYHYIDLRSVSYFPPSLFQPELTPINFPAYYARKEPFAILFTVSREHSGLYPVLGDMAAVTEVPGVTLAWMDL